MTVKELIAKLEAIEDKDKTVMVYSYDDVSVPDLVKETAEDDIDCHGAVLII